MFPLSLLLVIRDPFVQTRRPLYPLILLVYYTFIYRCLVSQITQLSFPFYDSHDSFCCSNPRTVAAPNTMSPGFASTIISLILEPCRIL